MSLTSVLARIDVLQTQITGAPRATAPAASTAAAATTTTTTGTSTGTWGSAADTSFGSALTSASSAPSGVSSFQANPTGVPAIVQAAEGEVGQAESPPGSNDSPRIAQYRAATAGSGVGPWCAYFASWAAQQAGVPLGEQGQGFGAVGAVAGWAQRTGRWNPAGSGTPPVSGDLIVFGGRHIGIVESVDPDGGIHTIEGNSSDAVSRRTYGPDAGGATGFVHTS